MGEVQLSRRFGADGWYAVVAGIAGLVAGLALSAWRSRDLLASTILVVIGSALAALVMLGVGQWLGPGDPDAALAAATPGARVPDQLTVAGAAVLLVWPIATLVGALVVLWSPRDDRARGASVRRPTAAGDLGGGE